MTSTPSQAQALLAPLSHQPQVHGYLTRALTEGKVSHASLFIGRAATDQQAAALAVAQVLTCPAGGCGTCESCQKVAHSFLEPQNAAHPDVHVYAPGSATGYLLEQVEAIIAAANRSAVGGGSKVFVIQEAQRLGTLAANALLKTLEEPPARTCFILIAPAANGVLPTIVSRCQVVPFAPTNAAAVEEQVAAAAQVSLDEARQALAIYPDVAKACALLKDPDRWALRQQAADLLGNLPHMSDADIVLAARSVAEAAGELSGEMDAKELKERLKAKGLSDAEKRALQDQLAAREQEEQIRADYLTRGAQKALEQQERRQRSAQDRSAMMEVVACCRSLLADALASKELSRPLSGPDAASILAACGSADVSQLLAAIESANRASSQLATNVDGRLVLEAMLFAFKEALCPMSYR